MSQHPNIELFRKIIALEVQGVSIEQIASVVGFDVSHIYEIRRSDIYRKEFEAELEKNKVKNTKFDDSWDNVEEEALKIVSKNLTYNKDPNFALKAAMLANRATRRSHPLNKPLDANGNGSPKAIITLNATFINKLSAPTIPINLSGFGLQTAGKTIEHKTVNMLNPADVEAILTKEEKETIPEKFEPNPQNQELNNIKVS